MQRAFAATRVRSRSYIIAAIDITPCCGLGPRLWGCGSPTTLRQMEEHDTDKLKAMIMSHYKIQQEHRPDVGCLGRAQECGWIAKVSGLGSFGKAATLWLEPLEVRPAGPQ